MTLEKHSFHFQEWMQTELSPVTEAAGCVEAAGAGGPGGCWDDEKTGALELVEATEVVLLGELLALLLPLLLNLPPIPGPGKLGAFGFMGNLDCVTGLLVGC